MLRMVAVNTRPNCSVVQLRSAGKFLDQEPWFVVDESSSLYFVGLGLAIWCLIFRYHLVFTLRLGFQVFRKV